MLYKIYKAPGDWQTIDLPIERCVLREVDMPETEESKAMGYQEFNSIDEAAKSLGVIPWTKNED
jgi:hypothetical protein